MQPIHYCAVIGHVELFSLLCDQYGVSPVSAQLVSYLKYMYILRVYINSKAMHLSVCSSVCFPDDINNLVVSVLIEIQ